MFPGVYQEAVRIVAKTGLELRPHGAVGPVIAAPAGSDAVQIIQSPGAYVGGFIVDRGGIVLQRSFGLRNLIAAAVDCSVTFTVRGRAR